MPETRRGQLIEALKYDLVLQLYLERGPFSETVGEVRDRWDIEPVTWFPPQPVEGELLPPGLSPQPPPPSSEKEYEEWFDTYERWCRDLEGIARSAIPRTYIGEKFRPDWGSFVSVCVLCQPSVSSDPSAPKLTEFAGIGGPWPTSLPLKPNKDYPGGPLMAVKAPIRVMSDPAEETRIEVRCCSARLRGVWELYLKPQGIGFDRVLAEVHRAYPEIEQERSEALSRNRGTQKYWIEVEEGTRVKDIPKYLPMISESQEGRPELGASRTDRLECVECAVLRLHHNWSLEQLAKRYPRMSESTLKRRINKGRDILDDS